MIHAMFTISMVAPPSSEQRMNAFAKVYSEGRWLNGADGALCLSGWSAVKAGQGKKALAAVVHVMTKYELNAVLDIPVGDGCFAEALIKQIREERNVSYHGVSLSTSNIMLRGEPFTFSFSVFQAWTLCLS